MTQPADFFSPGGALARVLPGYEERKAQIRLSQAVADVIPNRLLGRLASLMPRMALRAVGKAQAGVA